MGEERIIKMPVEVYECPTKVTEAHTDELLDIMLASVSTMKFKVMDDTKTNQMKIL